MFLVLLLVLIGCNSYEEKNSSKNTAKQTNSTRQLQEETEPPDVKLTIGGNVIKTHRGTYSWGYVDQSTGENVMMNADHAPPNEMVNIDEGVKVDLSEPINLSFDKEPTQYEIRLWDNEHVIKTYNSFEEITETGNYIIEIVATWGDSTATYVAAIEID